MFSERRKNFTLSYEGKYTLLGLVFGVIIGLTSDYIINHVHQHYTNIEKEVSSLKEQSSKYLIDYVRGDWVTADGDVNVNIDVDTKKRIIIVHVNDTKTSETKYTYTIKNIVEVDGLSGVLRLNICNDNSKCSDSDTTIIQINKVFGTTDTITVTYPAFISQCTRNNNICTRAFNRKI